MEQVESTSIWQAFKRFWREDLNLLGKCMLGITLGGAGIIILVLLLSALWPFYSVPTGSRGVVTTFGKITGSEEEGLVILPPWKKLAIFSIRAEQADIEHAEGSTSDTQAVNVSLTVRYAINPDKVLEVYEKYSHTGDLSSYIQTATQEVFKSVTARYTASELISKRAEVSAGVVSSLQKRMDVYGAQIISVDMRSFGFSASYTNAINEKVTQEQLRLAAENKLKTVEAEQKQKVAIAEAEADAAKATADGNAYVTLTNATAQANALKVQNAALAKNKDVLELRRIEVEQTKADRWDGKLPEAIYGSAPIPFLNTK